MSDTTFTVRFAGDADTLLMRCEQIQQAINKLQASAASINFGGSGGGNMPPGSGGTANSSAPGPSGNAAGVATRSVAPGSPPPPFSPTGWTPTPPPAGPPYTPSPSPNTPPPLPPLPQVNDPTWRASLGQTGLRFGFRGGAEEMLGLNAAVAGANLVGSGFSYGANRILNGGSGIDEQYQLGASALSATVGVLVGGLTMNPAIGFGASAITESVASPLARYLSAPAVEREKAGVMLDPIMGMYAGAAQRIGAENAFVGGPVARNPNMPIPLWAPSNTNGSLQKLTDILNTNAPVPGTVDDVAAAFSGVASGLYAGGRDPFQTVGGYREVTRPWENYGGRSAGDDLKEGGDILTGKKKSHFSLIDGLIDVTKGFVKEQPRVYDNPSETVSEMYTRRIGQLVGPKALPSVAKDLAPMFAAEPDTGGNMTDILTRFGAERTNQYLRVQSDDLTLPDGLDPMKLSSISADYRKGNRSAALAALQSRNVGLASYEAYHKEKDALMQMPDGVNSLAYAEANAKERGSLIQSLGEAKINRYGLPMAKLEGEMQRYDVSPYSPGNRMGTTLQMLGMTRDELSQEQVELNGLRKSGNLSEEEELKRVQGIESLKTGRARMAADLVDGVANRLPAMAAGRPSFADRIDSRQMTAMQFGLIGHPYRGAGALNDQQRQAQQDFVNSYLSDPSEIDSRSRTAPLNNRGGSAHAAGVSQGSAKDNRVYGAPSASASAHPVSGGASAVSGGDHNDNTQLVSLMGQMVQLLQQLVNRTNGSGGGRTTGMLWGEENGRLQAQLNRTTGRQV